MITRMLGYVNGLVEKIRDPRREERSLEKELNIVSRILDNYRSIGFGPESVGYQRFESKYYHLMAKLER